jgi:hypothetical protein
MPHGKRNQKPPCLQVIVTVSGGVADVLCKPPGIAVAIYDYDVEGSDEGDPHISKDPDGQLCCARTWEPSDEVVGCQHWPIIRRAREGSYSRSWKCSGCGRTIEHSYEALAEVGSPICPDCDIEMEMQ